LPNKKTSVYHVSLLHYLWIPHKERRQLLQRDINSTLPVVRHQPKAKQWHLHFVRFGFAVQNSLLIVQRYEGCTRGEPHVPRGFLKFKSEMV